MINDDQIEKVTDAWRISYINKLGVAAVFYHPDTVKSLLPFENGEIHHVTLDMVKHAVSLFKTIDEADAALTEYFLTVKKSP